MNYDKCTIYQCIRKGCFHSNSANVTKLAEKERKPFLETLKWVVEGWWDVEGGLSAGGVKCEPCL